MVSGLDVVEEEIRKCRRCPLHQTRRNPVAGYGNPSQGIVFVGEAPGYNEDLQGLPFVGAAGRLLDEMLSEIGISRDKIYITNVLKCRPPSNRDPLPDEIDACLPFLKRQLQIINPWLIVCMGSFAMRYVFSIYGIRENKGITSLHGRVILHNTLFGRRYLIPVYHPAAALHNPSLKDTLREDFLEVGKVIHQHRKINN